MILNLVVRFLLFRILALYSCFKLYVFFWRSITVEVVHNRCFYGENCFDSEDCFNSRMCVSECPIVVNCLY